MSSKIYIEIAEKFPERLREIRLEKGLDQADLAEKISVTRGAIGQFEQGLNLPSADTLSRLAQALDVSLDWLAGLSDRQNIRKPKAGE